MIKLIPPQAGTGLCCWCWFAMLTVTLCPSLNAADFLQNEALRAEFDARGLVAIRELAVGRTIPVNGDGFVLSTRLDTVDTGALKPSLERETRQERIYRFEGGDWRVKVIYELKPGWRFVSKQILITAAPGKDVFVKRVEVLRAEFGSVGAEVVRVRDGALLRFSGGAGATPAYGLFLVLQCPFLQWKSEGRLVSVAYEPAVDWSQAFGPFVSERVCFGPYTMSGLRQPAVMTSEWKWIPENTLAGQPPGAWLDLAETEALTDCVRAFLLWKPRQSVRVHVGWCENDYQIDVGTPAGREEYGRIVDMSAALGCRNVLYSPANSQVSSLAENRDAWGWENILWLGMGQKIRKGEWSAEAGKTPASVSNMLEYARSKNLRLLAYVYPSLPFSQNPDWTKWIKDHRGGYLGADTGQPSFQDWLLNQLVSFQKLTGVGGYSFDHWWIAYDESPSSKYAQWAGCRKVLENLRQQVPDAVIDGRQQYHQFGVWTWLAGTYPHPLNSDEQPQSFRAFPDLHWDRVSADRQRYAAWWYRQTCFVPPEIMPGYIGHQTPRNDARGVCRRDRYRATDWDCLGWRYSLLSSIATAPFNHVVNMIPARDEAEFQSFSDVDRKWFREWLDWTDLNFDILRNLRPITAHPTVGRVDGTAAFKGDRGFVFWFNPNYRPLQAQFKLDESIGLQSGSRFLLRQLYPDVEKGRLIVHPAGVFWARGETVALAMPGASALVLEVAPAPDRITEPVLFGAIGRIGFTGERLELADVPGEVGVEKLLKVLVPARRTVTSLFVNGIAQPFSKSNDLVTARVRFAGQAFGRLQQIGRYDPKFSGGSRHAEMTVPERVFQQLRERRRQWPVAYTDEDLLSTWLGSDRLLLFVNVVEPVDTMEVTLKKDGQPVPLKKAYTSVYPQAVENTFVGWYADLSSLAPDKPHQFEVSLPRLAPGQFQGLFLDNVEQDYTTEIAR